MDGWTNWRQSTHSDVVSLMDGWTNWRLSTHSKVIFLRSMYFLLKMTEEIREGKYYLFFSSLLCRFRRVCQQGKQIQIELVKPENQRTSLPDELHRKNHDSIFQKQIQTQPDEFHRICIARRIPSEQSRFYLSKQNSILLKELSNSIFFKESKSTWSNCKNVWETYLFAIELSRDF